MMPINVLMQSRSPLQYPKFISMKLQRKLHNNHLKVTTMSVLTKAYTNMRTMSFHNHVSVSHKVLDHHTYHELQ
jgi:hypothetical protein